MLLKIEHDFKYNKEQLNFKYKQDQDIEFNKMQITGRNGSGKTTLLNGIYNGKGLVANCKRSEIVKISQFTSLFNNLTIKENLVLHSDEWQINFDKFCYFFPEIDINVKVKELSGGQKQILNIVIGLSMECKLYLIDEPFNNLDARRKKQLSDYLALLECALIIVAHGEVLVFCDKRLNINDEEISYETNVIS